MADVPSAGRPDRGIAKIPAGLAMLGAGLLLVGLLAVPSFFGATTLYRQAQEKCTDTSDSEVQPEQTEDASGIPANYLKNYKAAGAKYKIPWNVLAGIGKIETNHGQSNLPGVHRGENFAGAGGPMQFLQPTWNMYGVDADGDGKKNRYDPDDAIHGAGNYLKASGAPQRMRKAIWAYNHSNEYINNVLAQAKRYAKGDFNVVETKGELDCADMLTSDVPDALTAKILKFMRAQLGKPYVYGGNGPDVWDCSGIMVGAYKTIGVQLPRIVWDQWKWGKLIPRGQEKPGDLIYFHTTGSDDGGPNRPGHIGMVVGKGKHLNARCTACKPGVGIDSYKGLPTYNPKTNSPAGRKGIHGFRRILADPRVKKQLGDKVESGFAVAASVERTPLPSDRPSAIDKFSVLLTGRYSYNPMLRS